MDTAASLKPLQVALGYTFNDKALLVEALTHPSYAHEHPGEHHYQRLEFLGDAVLGLCLAELLYLKFPNVQEGFLAEAKSTLGSRNFIAQLARQLGLEPYLRLGNKEVVRDSVLENTLEALIAAVYLDGRWDAARTMIHTLLAPSIENLDAVLKFKNPKGKLQEILQTEGYIAEYVVLETTGPAHEPHYRVALHVSGCPEIQIIGEGRSRKVAEEAAAKLALTSLEGHLDGNDKPEPQETL